MPAAVDGRSGQSGPAINKHSTAISEIVSTLINAYETGQTLNFTSLKNSVAKKRKLKGIPKVVDVLAAIELHTPLGRVA